VRALDRFDVQVEAASCGVGADSGISRVRKRAGLFTAETRDVVLVATEGLVLGRLEFEAAEIGANNGPNKVVFRILAHTFEQTP
jgi:hypothetical protein